MTEISLVSFVQAKTFSQTFSTIFVKSSSDFIRNDDKIYLIYAIKYQNLLDIVKL